MDNDQKYSCTSELGAEILMVIISFIIAAIALYIVYLEGFSMFETRKDRKLSSKDAGIFLSSAFALFLPLMSYLFSQAKQHNPQGRAQLILVWMVLIEFLRVHSGDSAWELKKPAEQLVRLLWVAFLVYGYTRLDGLKINLFILCIFAFAYEVLKGTCFHKAKNSYLIGRNPKLIQNHIKRVMLQNDLRTIPMNRCEYIVMGEENHETIICENGYDLGDRKSNSEGMLTIGRVFQLSTLEDKAFTLAHPYWRDSCLSLSLAKMLRRRFINLPLYEAGNIKALQFVEGLIDYIGCNEDIHTEGTNGERNPFERVFQIIQDELMFVSEYSNTKVPTYCWNMMP